MKESLAELSDLLARQLAKIATDLRESELTNWQLLPVSAVLAEVEPKIRRLRALIAARSKPDSSRETDDGCGP